MSSNPQWDEALQVGNARRQAISRVKRGVKDGSVTVGEVLIAAPAAIDTVRLADVVEWPWPKMGLSRRMKIGKAATREGLNLLLPIGKASRYTRVALTNIIGDVMSGPLYQPMRIVASDENRDDEIDRVTWMLGKAERDRDAALERVVELERVASVHQIVLPTLEAERMVAELADAIEVHRRTISNQKLPPEDWCTADPELWKAKDAILAGEKPTLRAVA